MKGMPKNWPPPYSSFELHRNKWWHLTLTAMSPGKLLCLKHVLEAFHAVDDSRPKIPFPAYLMGPEGRSPYVVLTQLTSGALFQLKTWLRAYQKSFMAGAESEKKRLAETPMEPGTLRRELPLRHPLVDEFLIFLELLPEPSQEEDPQNGPHMLAQVTKLCTEIGVH